MQPFTPLYILETELAAYGLPTTDVQPDILNLVSMASSIIDEACGRFDGDGVGSLVYTTYAQRLLIPSKNRNLVLLPLKPLVALDQATVTNLQNAATGAINYTYTGVLPSTLNKAAGDGLSAIVSASGRYGYVRQDTTIGYPDLFAMINPLNLVTVFGGPPPWVVMDVPNIDYDPKTGEAWLPVGLQLQRYSEILITYTSGWNPLAMPPIVKQVCAAIVKNAMLRGDGTTGMMTMSISKGGVNTSFSPQLIDPTLDRLLTPYKNVRAL
jgi:hypothetical protein